MAEVADRHQGVMAGLVPAIHEGPAHLAGKREKPCDRHAFLPVAPGGTRSGGPASMAGTSPAMTARVYSITE